MQSRINQRRSQLPAWQLLFVLLAVLAAGTQQLVAATHWHAAVAADSATGSTDGDPGRPHDCLWCHVAAHASAAVSPAPLPALAVAGSYLVLVSAEHPLAVIPAPAHAWQSRGPPAI